MIRIHSLKPAPTRVALAAALAVLHIGAAHAQTAPAPADSADGLKLDSVVVTGTSSGATKMKSSVSISTLGADLIKQTNSASEIGRAHV